MKKSALFIQMRSIVSGNVVSMAKCSSCKSGKCCGNCSCCKTS